MKIFQIVRRLLPLIGLLHLHQDQPRQRAIAIVQRICVFASIIYGAITAIWFIAFDAVTVDGLAKATSSFVIYIYAFMVFTAAILRQGRLISMFQDLESAIEKRK